jgi:hypothetical protein
MKQILNDSEQIVFKILEKNFVDKAQGHIDRLDASESSVLSECTQLDILLRKRLQEETNKLL